MADYGGTGNWCLSKENGNHGWDKGCNGISPVKHASLCCAHFEGITVNATSFTAPWHELTHDLRQIIIDVIEKEAQDALDTGMRPIGGRELQAWNFVAEHFKQWAPLAADRIVERYKP